MAGPPAPPQWSERQRYVFKRTLEELSEYRGTGTSLVTLYVPPTRQLSDVTAMVRDEVGQASNIKSKSTQDAVTGALTSILARLKNYKSTPPNGLAIFVGDVNIGANKTMFVAHLIEPPVPIATYQYRCESTFNLEPLKALGSVEDVYGLIVIDRKECSMGFLRGKAIQPVFNRQSQVPSKHGRGGQSAQRFERLIEIAAHEWFVYCAEKATEIFLSADVKAILLAGPGPTKEFFAREEFLHHELRKKLHPQFFDVGYTDDDQGLKELVEAAGGAIQGIAMLDDRKLMQRFLREMGKQDGGLGAYGETECRASLEAGAVDHLLLSENLRKVRLTFTNRQSGEVVVKTVGTMQTEEAVAEQSKKWGGNQTEVGRRDLVEELSDLAEQSGAQVHIVSGASEEGGILMGTFGGVVALLRYKIR
ncbi:MAG TPA: peptide chain release factor aRF-1 [Candidatus Thermoplasmatota archaeon]|nr:peptide chain release factor aRF-1 [Candidatus Thermoplasmatota archaeon]